MKTTPCPFCDEKQSYRYILGLEKVRAIYPKSAACKYHVLIIPKRHVASLDLLSKQEILESHDLLQGLVAGAKKNIPDFIGYNLLSNNGGPAVSQQVMHCHMHLFLRTKSDLGNPLQSRHSTVVPELSTTDKNYLNELKNWFLEE